MFLSQIEDYKWQVSAIFKGDINLNIWATALRLYIEIVSDEIYYSKRTQLNLRQLLKYDLGQLLLQSKHHRRSIIPMLLHHIESQDFTNRTWTSLLTNFSKSRFLYCQIYFNIEMKTKRTRFDGTFIISTDSNRQYETAIFSAKQGNLT